MLDMYENGVKIREQVQDYTTLDINRFDIKNSQYQTIVSGQYVLDYMLSLYADYKTRARLIALWDIYETMHHDDFLRAWTAWTAAYNPLDNYNGTETNVFLNQDGVLTQRVTHGKTTTVTANDVTTTGYSTTFDSSTERETDKNVQTGNTTNAETGTTATTTEHTPTSITVDGTTYTADSLTAEIKKRQGNLGVTTSQQMITSEIEMRLKSLVCMYIDTFIKDYAYYVSDGWCKYDY